MSNKRFKTNLSCSVCRKRKSKCDRARPVCGSCKKKSLAHLCYFENEIQRPPAHVDLPETGHETGENIPQNPPPPPIIDRRPQLVALSSLPPASNPYPAMAPMHSPHSAWSASNPKYFDQLCPPPQYFGHAHDRQLAGVYPAAMPQEPNSASSVKSDGSFPIISPQDSSHAAALAHAHTISPINSMYPQERTASHSSENGSSERSNSNSNMNSNSHSHASERAHRSEGTLKTDSPTVYSLFSKSHVSHAAETADSSKFAISPEHTALPVAMHHSASDNGRRIQPHSTDTELIAGVSENNLQYSKHQTLSQFLEVELGEPRYVSVSIGSIVLRIDIEDTIDAFSCASSTLLVEGSKWQQQGPLSYVGLTKQDQFFRLVRNFTVRLFRSEQFSQFVSKQQNKQAPTVPQIGATDKNPPAPENIDDDSECVDDILDEDSLVTSKIYPEKNQGEANIGRGSRNSEALMDIQSLGAVNTSKVMFYRFVESRVIETLPSRGAMAEAINKYFQYVHPFIPIFDKTLFLKEVQSLFKHDAPIGAKEKHTKISIRSHSSLNLTGQLLLVIRLGYMTLIPNSQPHLHYTKVEQTLIKDVTSIKADQYLNVVHMCIPEGKLQVKSTLKLVQSLTLLFFYRSVAPNDCLGLSGSDSQILHGSIVNHALSIGLNRDPLKYESIRSIPKNTSFVLTWRSLWNYIVNLDALGSIYCGTPLKIPSLGISDTEKPNFENTSVNVAKFMKTVDSVCLCYRRIVNKITNLSTKLKVIDLLLETSKLERIFLEIFGKDFFKDYICGPAPEFSNESEPHSRQKNEEAYLKVHRFLLFINTRANLSCLYYLIVLHYEKKLDDDPGAEAQAGIELFKIFIRSVIQLVYIMSYVLDNMRELFGKSYDFILTSRIERSMIKTHTFVSAFFIRLVNYKRTLALKEMSGQSSQENFGERCEVVDNLFTIILLEAELFVGHFRTLSKTYINSYKLYVMAFFVLKQCMENPEILLAGVTNSKESFFNDGTHLIQFLSNAELQSLCKLCEEFRLAKLESIRRQKEHENSRTTEVAKGSTGREQLVNVRDRSEFPHSTNKTADRDIERHNDANDDEHDMSFDDDLSSQISSNFDATSANRAMYANEDTVNTYGLLTEKHMQEKFQGEVFDEQNMIGNDELLKLFDSYGLLDA